MEGGGRQSRLLSRLLGRLRGDHHKYNTLDKRYSLSSTGHSPVRSVANSVFYFNTHQSSHNEAPNLSSMSECTACSTCEDEELSSGTPSPDASTAIEHDQFAANIDLRYGGQYLTPEQLPEFCDQLHHLVEVIRNIQSYAKVTGEYPSELERRLEHEAREVSAIAAEARNAREVVARVRAQRRAVRAHRKNLVSHLTSLRESEFRELESTVRLSDRKLFKSWETLKDSTDPAAFEPLLDEIKNKQTALECLLRLIHSKQSSLARGAPTPTPLPPPEPVDHDESGVTGASGGSAGRKRSDCTRESTRDTRRVSGKRRRREPRSVPLSGEPSRHGPPPQICVTSDTNHSLSDRQSTTPQVTLYIQGTESTSRYRVGSAGAVALTPLELPSGGSVRDILFFTTN
ncbi:hypothetical protein PYW07_008808 [Mythimna separata]|uniref:Uncharacterized protein n=1 Tax=Mythimna separata TaxID=271217 RepID=A0AAD7YAE0_MYTSE|nr:hypothetical protein PYW07_008808 [Mythimna separata]